MEGVDEPSDTIPSIIDVDQAGGEDDDGDPVFIQKCPHLRVSVKVDATKKGIAKSWKSGEPHCLVCKKNSTKLQDPPIIWLCLACGTTHCGRNDAQHAEAHSKETRHMLVLQIENLACWCYSCDDFIVPSGDRNQVLKEVHALVNDHKRNVGGSPVFSADKAPLPTAKGKLTSGGKGKSGTIAAPGLKNLGNTCFFNSVMQCMTYSPLLQDFALASKNADDLSKLGIFSTIDLSRPLTRSIVEFLNVMRTQTQCGKYTVVNPAGLFTQLGNKYKVYKSFRQQDSHELLRCLVDGAKEEQLKKDTKGKPLPGQVTFADEIFGGKLVSIVVCDVCKHASYSFEEFLDLSVPIVHDEKRASGIFSAFSRLSRSSSPTAERSQSPSRRRRKSFDGLADSLSTLSLKIDAGKSPKLGATSARLPSPSRGAEISALAASPEELAKNQLIEKLLRQLEPAMSDSGGAAKLSVSKCLQSFMSVDILDGNNKLVCEACNGLLKDSDKTPRLAPASRSSSHTSLFGLQSRPLSPLILPAASTDNNGEPSAETNEGLEATEGGSVVYAAPKGLAVSVSGAEAPVDEDGDKKVVTDDSRKPISNSSVVPPSFVVPLRDNSAARTPSPRMNQVGTAAASSSSPKKPVILTRGYKRYLIHSFPRILVVHLKRFQQTGNGRTKKIEEHVVFREFLDMGVYLSPAEVVEKAERKSRRTPRSSGRTSPAEMATAVSVPPTEVSSATHPSSAAASVETTTSVASDPNEGTLSSDEALQNESSNVSQHLPADEVANGDIEAPKESSEAGDEDSDSAAETFDVPETTRTTSEGMYRLTGIVVHAGSLFGGHYVAYVRRTAFLSDAFETAGSAGAPADPEWLYISDTSVRGSSWDEVSKAQAYLLFYQRIDVAK
ncbi:hypothetical protein DFJ73DRAFT_809061 [Zopfochytrium polystomum]|nr:hypothetical protein DFJ73DRAFT_809061 [Zopfochytrium polystomum]